MVSLNSAVGCSNEAHDVKDFIDSLSTGAASAAPPSTASGGRRTVVVASYGIESRLIAVDDRESPQDFA